MKRFIAGIFLFLLLGWNISFSQGLVSFYVPQQISAAGNTQTGSGTTTASPGANANTTTSPTATTNSGEGLVPCGNGDSANGERPADSCTIFDIFKLIEKITNFLIGVAGIFAVLMIVYAGFAMVSAVGNPEALKRARSRLTSAIFGLIIVMAAFLLVNTLLSGSLSLGIKNGANILSNPFGYITGK